MKAFWIYFPVKIALYFRRCRVDAAFAQTCTITDVAQRRVLRARSGNSRHGQYLRLRGRVSYLQVALDYNGATAMTPAHIQSTHTRWASLKFGMTHKRSHPGA